MEPTPPVLAKKLWNIVRVVFLMMRKGISKRKLMVDLHLMMKRGKIAGKAIGNLMFHHHTNFSCRSQDPHLSFITPREYEFSCSTSPAFPFHATNKRKHHHQNHHRNNHHHHHHNYFSRTTTRPTVNDDDIMTVTAVKKLLEMLNNEVVTECPSPVVPGFGRTPLARQLRITDSPYPLKNSDEDSHVDEQAEEFIEKFYQQLRLQK